MAVGGTSTDCLLSYTPPVAPQAQGRVYYHWQCTERSNIPENPWVGWRWAVSGGSGCLKPEDKYRYLILFRDTVILSSPASRI